MVRAQISGHVHSAHAAHTRGTRPRTARPRTSRRGAARIWRHAHTEPWTTLAAQRYAMKRSIDGIRRSMPCVAEMPAHARVRPRHAHGRPCVGEVPYANSFVSPLPGESNMRVYVRAMWSAGVRANARAGACRRKREKEEGGGGGQTGTQVHTGALFGMRCR